MDILVNNLGIFEVRAVEEISDEDWRRFFEVNVLSGARLARLYLPAMRQRNWGRIIFISSESGYQIPAEMIHYGMTKAAQIAVARGLAETTSGTGITVNTVLPGPTRSRGVGDFVAEMAAKSGVSVQTVEKEFFKTARADIVAAALRNSGGGRVDGGVRRESARFGDQRCGAARRRRNGQVGVLDPSMSLLIYLLMWRCA